uniref:bifunctional DNA-formamidopyrimidine glycosylase/DNA-(apurinic or apyrimidinic site) lyase n=1 Tax=Ningiella ruwaisensis TaxID=2364274 RepID=UPI0010A044A5|nr:bifunctional DNA-formamidopyrimidine glycosylase/DNA-(apurinic or apyrimidinic site) lyase [Ningiella ruwaisensis]
MPELPEVEVTRLGILPYLHNQTIERILVHQPQMRWPVPQNVHLCEGLPVSAVSRRAKYLFITTQAGSLVLHLGMSGRMRVVDQALDRQKHDHIEIFLSNGKKLVLNDARRFGSCLWQGANEQSLKLLENLGPEPLTAEFDENRLYTLSRGRQSPVKNFIMDNQVVVGVGNIYANEALFLAGIDPRRKAGKVSRARYVQLTKHIKEVLAQAIKQGGTTLKDFAQADGNPGYFALKLNVYGKAGQACVVCNTPIRSQNVGQRNTFFCIKCQK